MTDAIRELTQAPYDPTAQSRQGLEPGALGKEDFLTLLIAQLSHQDPMKPTDPTEFVTQLSQFSSLEQLVNIKSGLDLLAITQTAGTSAQMVSFIGKTVEFDDTSVAWKDGSAPVSMSYELPRGASEVTVRIADSRGNTVDTRKLGAVGEGTHGLTFDGKKADGSALPDGTYHVEISAKDASGNTIAVKQHSRGVVTGVTFAAGYPQLLLADGRTLGLGQVVQVLEGASAAVDASAAPLPTTADPSDDGDGQPDDLPRRRPRDR